MSLPSAIVASFCGRASGRHVQARATVEGTKSFYPVPSQFTSRLLLAFARPFHECTHDIENIVSDFYAIFLFS